MTGLIFGILWYLALYKDFYLFYHVVGIFPFLNSYLPEFSDP